MRPIAIICGLAAALLICQAPSAHGQANGKVQLPNQVRPPNGANGRTNTMSPQAQLFYNQLVAWFKKYQNKENEWTKDELAKAFGHKTAYDAEKPGLKKPAAKEDDNLPKDPESVKSRRSLTNKSSTDRNDKQFMDAVDTSGDEIIDFKEFSTWARAYAMAQLPNKPMMMPNRMPRYGNRNPYRRYGNGYGNRRLPNRNNRGGMGGTMVALARTNTAAQNRPAAKSAPKQAPKSAARKAPPKKAAPKKAAPRKAAPRKAAPRKPAARRAPPRRPAPKRAPARRGGGRRR